MALIPCPECGRQVSTMASACPGCGCPISQTKPQINLTTWTASPGMGGGQSSKISISDNASPEEVASVLAQIGMVDPSEFCGQLHLYQEKDGSVSLIDDSGFPYAILRKQTGQTLTQPYKTPEPTGPRCPTCGSTNIEEIGAVTRGIALGMFGLASKTARSQFRCKSCNYKW